MIRKGHRNSVQLQLFPPLQDISPWNTTPKASSKIIHLYPTQQKLSVPKKRLSFTSINNQSLNRPRSSKISKHKAILPVVEIDFANKEPIALENYPSIFFQKPQIKPKALRESNSIDLNVKRNLEVERKVFNMNKRYSLKRL